MTLRHSIIFLIVLYGFCPIPAYSDSTFLIDVTPGVSVPLGDSVQYFSSGKNLNINAGYIPDFFPYMSVNIEGSYGRSPYGASDLFQMLNVGGGIGVYIPFLPELHLRGYANLGYNYSLISSADETREGAGTYLRAGVGFSWYPVPAFGIGLFGNYRNVFGVYQGVGVSVTGSVRIGESQQKAFITSSMAGESGGNRLPEGGILQIERVETYPVFPIFYSFYDENPIGRIKLTHTGRKALEDVSVNLSVSKYMDVPKEFATLNSFDPGETVEIDMTALFNEQMLEITEGMKVASEIIVEYTIRGTRYMDSQTMPLTIEYRNAMTWDDDRKAAAFITAKDPAILGFSKNVLAMIKEHGSPAINRNLRSGMVVHEALNIHGMTYVVDPGSAYEVLSEDAGQIDYLQFPRETLAYKAGDCDDLSILYNAILESVGIETAFITVPGHIYAAFSTGLSEKEAYNTFSNRDDLVIYDEKAWIPVEVTALKDNFLEAWQLGARQWRQYALKGQAAFIPVHKAWAVYRAIALPGGGFEPELPKTVDVVDAYMAVEEEFIRREIREPEASLKEQISRSSSRQKNRYRNKLGVLYARYGLFDLAEKEFESSVDGGDYVPGLVNLGNLLFLRKDYNRAVGFFERAERIRPDNPGILISLARGYHEIEKYTLSREYYRRVVEIDEDLAGTYAYLGMEEEESLRAADHAGLTNKVEWMEE